MQSPLKSTQSGFNEPFMNTMSTKPVFTTGVRKQPQATASGPSFSELNERLSKISSISNYADTRRFTDLLENRSSNLSSSGFMFSNPQPNLGQGASNGTGNMNGNGITNGNGNGNRNGNGNGNGIGGGLAAGLASLNSSRNLNGNNLNSNTFSTGRDAPAISPRNFNTAQNESNDAGLGDTTDELFARLSSLSQQAAQLSNQSRFSFGTGFQNLSRQGSQQQHQQSSPSRPSFTTGLRAAPSSSERQGGGDNSAFANTCDNKNSTNMSNGQPLSFTTGQVSSDSVRLTDLMLGRLSNLSQGVPRFTGLELGRASGLEYLGRLSGFPSSLTSLNLNAIGSNSNSNGHGNNGLANGTSGPFSSVNLENNRYMNNQNCGPTRNFGASDSSQNQGQASDPNTKEDLKKEQSGPAQNSSHDKDEEGLDMSDLVEQVTNTSPHVVGLNSLDLYMSFVTKYTSRSKPDEPVYVTSRVLSRECYEAWINTRRGTLKKPEESFRRALTAHITGADRRRPFPPLVEKSLLVQLRKQQTWPCFEGRMSSEGKEVKIGEQGFRTMGYHEKKAAESAPVATDQSHQQHALGNELFAQIGSIHKQADFRNLIQQQQRQHQLEQQLQQRLSNPQQAYLGKFTGTSDTQNYHADLGNAPCKVEPMPASLRGNFTNKRKNDFASEQLQKRRELHPVSS